jgi:hypothetical protein
MMARRTINETAKGRINFSNLRRMKLNANHEQRAVSINNSLVNYTIHRRPEQNPVSRNIYFIERSPVLS